MNIVNIRIFAAGACRAPLSRILDPPLRGFRELRKLSAYAPAPGIEVGWLAGFEAGLTFKRYEFLHVGRSNAFPYFRP